MTYQGRRTPRLGLEGEVYVEQKEVAKEVLWAKTSVCHY